VLKLGPLASATLRRKPGRVVVSLKKADAASWYELVRRGGNYTLGANSNVLTTGTTGHAAQCDAGWQHHHDKVTSRDKASTYPTA